jgi:ABC-type transport system involved in cytochrome bd biosynthesis fused ATPase/permease subunit
MERSKREEKENQMTIYFDKRAFEQQEEEEKKELEEQEKKEAAAKAAVTFIAFFVKPAIIMLLWNWLLPGIFGLATIGYFKALGLYLLARLFIDKE